MKRFVYLHLLLSRIKTTSDTNYLNNHYFHVLTVMYLSDIKSYICPDAMYICLGAIYICLGTIYICLGAMTTLYRWNSFTTV